jgi:hypothetical protein
MRGVLVLVLLLTACGGREVPPPSSTDGGSAVAAPRLDAGTGGCRDDYALTVRYCHDLDASEEGQMACHLATVGLYSECIGPRESCITRCQLEQTGADIQACVDSCPAATDAG